MGHSVPVKADACDPQAAKQRLLSGDLRPDTQPPTGICALTAPHGAVLPFTLTINTTSRAT